MDNYLPSIEFLREYQKAYPEIFEEYFTYHCKDTEERHIQSIEKYSINWERINQVHKNIKPIINEISKIYLNKYGVAFPIEVNLIVGEFGSNAYTHRQIIPDITFALEKLSPNPDHLRTIVAHEFGHAAQNIISNEKGMDWSKVEWNSPMIWLNQEGAATHLSRRIAEGLELSVYFSFDDSGDEWLSFANANKQEILLKFASDYTNLSPRELFLEWFSINGGKEFGYSRLAYFLADQFFQYQIISLGEMNAIKA